MGIRDFRDLVAWQLSYELKCEVFGRFRPREFARYLEYARASLMETQNHLIDGRDRGYLSPALYSRLFNLARSALKATTNLLLSKQRQAARPSRRAP